MAITSKDDASVVMDALTEESFQVTKMASTGGFLKSGNTTLMIGVEEKVVKDVVKVYKSIRRELDLYNEILKNKPEVVVLNKCDALPEKEIAKKQKALEKAIGKPVLVMSAVAKKGIFECLLAVNKFITRDRKKKEEAMVETTTPAEAVNKPWSPLD